ncbi:MAG: hypothetical protein ACYCZ6_07645 [Polaromonas sp.]
MNRCPPRLLKVPVLIALISIALGASLASTPVRAQADPTRQTGEITPKVRQFPKTALRGEMVVLGAPAISMDGKPDRLAPGARLFDTHNHLVLSNLLLNQKLVVNYLRDNTGQVQQVWILTDEEAREKRSGLQGTLFNFSTRFPAAPTDDGKTPYEQLPAYKQ